MGSFGHSSVIKLDGHWDCLVIEKKDTWCGVSSADRRMLRNLDPGCKPVDVKSLRFNQADKQLIKEELRQFLKDRFIQPSFSPWRALILVVRNPRHKLEWSQALHRQLTNIRCLTLVRFQTLIIKSEELHKGRSSVPSI